MSRHPAIRRLRALLAAGVLTTTALGIQGTPVPVPAIVREALTTPVAEASFCADEAGFKGRLTETSSTTAIASRIKDATVYGYISNVNRAWSCTAYYRYDGVAWNTTGSKGRFDWGVVISSTSVPCNYAVGTTTYVKGNATTDCADSDAEYALPMTLTAERVYQQDVNHNSVGDLSFIHSDCGTLYGGGDGEATSGTEADPENFNGTNANNRPGSNCDPLTLDGFQTTQTVTYDKTAPTLAITTPSALSGNRTGSYTVTFTATDLVAGFGGTATWSLQRQIAAIAGPGSCGTFANDVMTGNLVKGTTSGGGQTSAQTLTLGSCYRWLLSATDRNGNTATATPSASVIAESTAPVAAFLTPATGSTSAQNVTSYSVRWSETEAGSGVSARSLQRQKVAISAGACGTSWATDGSVVTTASPVAATLTSGFCHRWLQTLTDLAGNVGMQVTSGSVLVDTTSPMGDYAEPDEGTTTSQSSTSHTRIWTETAGSGATFGSRSTQRQTGVVVTPNTCVDVSWTNSGSPSTLAWPVSTSGLANNQCYRWVLTLTNSLGKTGTTTSGSVLIDATAPTGTIAYPEANRPLSGYVPITGTANDGSSFKDYVLDYGAGTSPSSWTTILTGAARVTSTGALGTWSTAGLSGVYTLRLTVHDNAGNAMTPATRTVYLENAGRGDETHLTRIPFALGGGYTLDVGVANGEARLSRDLFSIPSYGPGQGLSLTYNSLEPGAAGKFGVGWTSNLAQYLAFDSGFIVWHRVDGGREPFGNVGGTWIPVAGRFETLAAGTGADAGRYLITLKDQTRLVFEGTGAGRLVRIDNRFGKALMLVWNTSSATATDASGRATTIAIDSGNNRITGVTDSAGRVWSFGYTGAGASSDLTSIGEPDPDAGGPLAAPVTTLAYDASHQLTTVTRTRSRVSGSPETLTWTVGYDATSGKADRVTDPIDGAAGTPDRNKLTYGAGTTTVDILRTYGASPLYNTSTYSIDAWGRVTARVDPEGFTTSFAYDPVDATHPVLDPVTATRPIDATTSATTTYTYDIRGNVLSETVPIDAASSVVTATSYSVTNDVLTRSEADNDAAAKQITLFGYDASGHLLSVNVNCTTSGTTPPAAASSCTGAGTQDASTNLLTTYAHDANDQLAFELDPLGRVTKYTHDAWGNETSTTRNCTTTGTTPPPTFSTCTGAGTADWQTNVTTTAAFDQATVGGKLGLPTRTTDALGAHTDLVYDVLGRITTETLPGETGGAATIPALTRTTAYDEIGNTLTETETWTPIGGVTPVNRVTAHVYDTDNRETQVTDPSGGTTSTTFDAAGDELTAVQGGVTVTRTFDRLGRATQETADTDLVPTTHVFDAAGDEIATSSATESTTRTFTYTGWVLTDTSDAGGLSLLTQHGYDRLGRETSSTDPDGQVTATVFDRAGREVITTSAAGTTTTVVDRVGNAVAVKGIDGAVAATAFDPLDRPTESIGNCTNTGTTQPAAGATCAGTGTHDATTNLVTTTYYDAAGTAIAVRDTVGITTRTIPNVRGLALKTIANCTDSGTTPTSNPRACTGDPPGTQDPATNVKTTYTYDGTGATVGSVVAVGTGAAATTRTAYDAAGRVQASMDAAGTVSRSLYNTAGQLTGSIQNCTDDAVSPQPPSPTGSWWACDGSTLDDGTWNLTTDYGYDARGNRTSETAPNGRVTTSVYDDEDRLVTRIDNDIASPSGADQDVTTTYAYDAEGRLTATVAPTADGSSSVITRSVYDAAGRLTRTIAGCTVANAGDDPAGCGGDDGTILGTQTFEANVVTDSVYDAAGNLAKTIAPDPAAAVAGTGSVTTRYAHDSANRLCRVLESSTITDAAWTTAGCSGAVSGTTSTNLSTRYTYDPAGNLASAIDARGKTTSYGYDAASRLTSTTDPDGKTLVLGFNALGQKIRQENRSDPPMTASITWAYDGAGRILTRATGAATTSYTYDANGNPLTASDGTFTISATYDRLNRVLTVDDEDAGTTADTMYSYSLLSRSWTDPTGAYAATVDTFGRPTALDDPADPGGANFTFTYRADGQPASAGQPNGNTTALGYDALGRARTRTTTGTGGTSRAAYTWTRNQAGQVLSEASTITGDPTNNTRTFAYDSPGRLTSYTDGATTTTYGWAETLNRTSVKVGAGAAVPTTYDDANRPLDQAGVANAFASDADGRLIRRPDAAGAAYQQLTWDALGRLTSVKNGAGSTIATYAYDPLDRLRIIDYGAGVRTRFRYVGTSTSVAQVIDDATGNVTRNVGNAPGGGPLLDWTGSGSNIRVYGANGHHDVTWTANTAGAVTGTVRYDPWGAATSVTGSVPDFRYQGSFADDTTKLSWVITRWYAPAQGRFISEDSLLGELKAPDSRHLYAYGEGEPVARWDPDGRFWYRWRSGDTTTAVAARWLGGASRSQAIINTNRNRQRSDDDLGFPAGRCIWLPRKLWFADRSDWGTSQCAPTSYLITGDILKDKSSYAAWATEAVTAKFGDARQWYLLTGATLIRKTKSWTDRPFTITTHPYLDPNQGVGDALAVSMGLVGFSKRAKFPDADLIIAFGSPNPLVPGANDALTLGHFVFVSDRWNKDSIQCCGGPLLSHEYVHVLQWQGKGAGFAKRYVEEWPHGTGPRNPLEAPAYIWGAWTYFFHQYGEPYPWKVFRPH